MVYFHLCDHLHLSNYDFVLILVTNSDQHAATTSFPHKIDKVRSLRCMSPSSILGYEKKIFLTDLVVFFNKVRLFILLVFKDQLGNEIN